MALLAIAVGACTDATSPGDGARLAPFVSAHADLTTQLVPDEYIVVLRSDVEDVPAAAAASGAAVLARWDKALKGYAVRANAGQLRALRADPRVAFVEPNARVSKIATQSPTPSWGLDRIDQRNLPLNNSYTYANTGTGVHAYIIDTGIRPTHTEFTGRIGNGFTSINDGNGTNDCDGHGTHVSGTVGGTVHGVAKGVTLHPVRVLDCTGSGTWTGVINGINWVAANRQLPAVANMSLGGSFNSAVNTATDGLIAAGVFTAVASGNSSANACNYSPASTANAMTVNSTTNTDARSSFSNFGTCTDIFAPGSSIVSAYNTSNTATAVLSGTSMASPHVAGAGALYLFANPTHTPAQVDAALKNNATLNLVTNPGTGSPNRLLYMGFIGGGPSNQPPQANYTVTCQSAVTPSYCILDGTSSTDDNGLGNLSFAWTNDGGRPSKTGQTTKFFWSSPGGYPNTFNVTLTVTDGGGLSHAITKQVVIPPVGAPPSNLPPTADFTITCQTATTPHTCTVDASPSTDDGGFGNLSFTWTNNVGRPAKTGTSTTYKRVTWPYPNTFDVTLTALDSGGLSHSITKTVAIP
jgi:subtilisin family serine protease